MVFIRIEATNTVLQYSTAYTAVSTINNHKFKLSLNNT
jgi:hypothetical protein